MSLSPCYATKLTQAQLTPNLSTTPLQAKDRRRKRAREAEDPLHCIPATPLQKRPRKSLASSPAKDAFGQEAASGVGEDEVNPIDYWSREGNWPKEYFEQESSMSHLLARKKSSSSLRGKQSESNSVTPGYWVTSFLGRGDWYGILTVTNAEPILQLLSIT